MISSYKEKIYKIVTCNNYDFFFNTSKFIFLMRICFKFFKDYLLTKWTVGQSIFGLKKEYDGHNIGNKPSQEKCTRKLKFNYCFDDECCGRNIVFYRHNNKNL
jgi:hypothetical protein